MEYYTEIWKKKKYTPVDLTLCMLNFNKIFSLKTHFTNFLLFLDMKFTPMKWKWVLLVAHHNLFLYPTQAFDLSGGFKVDPIDRLV